MKENKEKEIFCDLDYFMKNKCKNCKLERLCNEWDNNRAKRDSNTVHNTNYCISNKEHRQEVDNYG